MLMGFLMPEILVTGANGFVGDALCVEAIKRSFMIRGVIRTSCDLPTGVETVVVEGIDGNTDWREALTGCEVVIHLAARVHVMRDDANDPLAEFRRVNTAGTEHLARCAAASGVKRLVYVSSIKVNGEETRDGQIYSEKDTPTPQDPYGVSKWEAEQALQRVAQETGLQVVIIRPPLVYGPSVKANFARMIKILKKGYPLPLGVIHNKRSLVALDNLVDLIVTCIDHPSASNQTFLAGDGEDLSTTELLQRMAKAMGRPVRLIPVPAKLLELGAALIGKRDVAQRLCGSLRVDISKAREVLGWTPPISVDEGLRRTAAGTKESRVENTSGF